jgi:uncharacterized repeat protein (TIGR01451 family)
MEARSRRFSVPHSQPELWTDSPRFRAMCEAVLSEGAEVRFRVRGMSMQPNLLDGEMVVVAPATKTELRRGEVVLSHSPDGLRVHRLVSIDSASGIVTRGDAGQENDPEAQKLLGRVIAIDRNGRRISMTQPGKRFRDASRILARRLKLAAALRFKRLGSSLALFGSLILFGILLNATPAAAQADLSIAQAASVGTISPGGTITYTDVAENHGPNAATAPVVTQAIPANTTFQSMVVPANWTCVTLPAGGTGTITCTSNANMTSGSASIFTIVVLVNTNTPGTTVIAASDNITSTTADPDLANNTDSTNVTVVAADLALTQTPNPTVVQPGGTITYTLSLTNNGLSPAANAVVYQQTPPNTTFQSVAVNPVGSWTCISPAVGGTGQIRCTDGANLNSGATVTFTVVVTVNAGTALGTVILNSADTTATTADPVPTNNASTSSTLVESGTQADLAVAMTASPTPVFISSNLAYTMQVQNLGLINTVDGQLVDNIPAGTTFVSSSTTQGSCAGTTTVTCTFGAVTNGSTITVAITVKTPNSPGTLTNTATVSSTTADPVAGNNSATVMTVVQPLVCASPGRDGAGGTLSGILNAYYPPAGAGTLAAGATSVALGAAAAAGAQTAIASGDLLLIIQMQDAAINFTNTSSYGHGTPGEPASGWTNLNNSGNFEYVTATNSVPVTGGTLNFLATGPTTGLLNTYTSAAYIAGTQGQRTYQVIRVPQYTSATLSSGLTAMIWNGATGGVLALDVSSQLTLGGTVAVDGLGFRGGAGRGLAGGAGAATDYVTLATNATNGSKGEGIAGTPRYVVNGAIASPAQTATDTGVEGLPNGSYSRGAPGNAAGGATDANPIANDQNSGGGGGGNGGAGGQGGFGWNSAGIVGGFGGAAFPSTTSALVMGGGGGAGTTNNASWYNPANGTGGANCGANCTGIYSSGAAGGGVLIIHASSVTGTGTVMSNGRTALDVENDGGGGGGAGGAIRILANSGGLAGLTVQANGGNGGNNWHTQGPEGTFPLDRHGPGGGGAGGAIFLSGAPAAATVTGGSPGTSTTALDPYGATVGAPGITNTTSTIPQTPGTQPGAYCASADLAVTNTGTPPVVVPGANITYTQGVTNNGPFDAVNAVFSETIPANTTFQSLTVPAGWSCTTPAVGATGNITCTNPSVVNGASSSFTLVVQVNPGTTNQTQITDVASVTSGTADSNLANNSASVTTIVGAATDADLVVTNAATPNPVVAGQNITYTQVVTNNGPASAASVSFTETLPANTTFVSLPTPAGWSCVTPAVGASGTITCTIASLASGGTATFRPVLQVTAGTPSGTVISDTASVNAATPDPNPTSNSATVNVVVATAGQADLAVATSASPNPVLGGGNITFAQTVTNNGPAAAATDSFTETVPANTTFVSLGVPAGWSCVTPAVGGTGNITCTATTLASGTVSSFPLVVKVNVATPAGTTISNNPSVSSATSDPTSSNNSASASTVVASPTQADVAIVKTATPEPVDQNTNLVYTLQVTNNGPAVAQGVTVSDPLPAQVSFASVSTTQGSCSQSAGTVTCNIGTLSVGSLAIITINVTANTFSSGSTASNTATVSATTGDPNLTNNTSTAITTIQAPTAVQLVSFRAIPRSDGSLILEWKTREEVRNLGFNVYREDAAGQHRLNPALIAGSALVLRHSLPQHAAKTYQWLDPQPVPGASYWLEDVDLSGAKNSHGPAQFESSVRPESAAVTAAPLLASLNQNAARATSLAMSGAPRWALSHPLPVPDPSVERVRLENEPAVKISAQREGWYRVTRAQLLSAGLDPRANAQTLQLFAEGVEQPILILGNQAGPLGPNDAIEFYGTGIDTPFSDTRVYWLVSGGQTGKRISLARAFSGGPQPQAFPATAIREDRTTYFAALLNGENQDNFFGALVTNAPVDQELDVVHSLNSNLPVTLDVTLQGVTDGQDHSVSVVFNGAFVGNLNFSNQANFTTNFPVDPGLVHDGTNTVTLTALNGDNDVSLVQSIVLHYAHAFTADNDWLRMQAAAGSQIHVSGFSNPQVRVFDITDPQAIEQIPASVQLGTSGFSIDFGVSGSPASGQSRTLVAVAADQIASPSALNFHARNGLLNRQAGASVVLITHPDFLASLTPLVRLREEQGYTVKVVTTDVLFDAYNFGERTPFALRDYLQEATLRWRTRPRFVLLVGDASLDPRNYLGFGDFDFVPTRLIDTAAMKTASDDWFTDFNQTGYGTIPIGRLPVRTATEADLVISKIVDYERGNNTGDWNRQALVVADQNVGANFSATTNAVATALGKTFAVTKILGDQLDPQTTKQQILDAINSGQGLVNFVGHGSVEQWSFTDLLDGSDAVALQNGERLPVFLIMDCLNGFFQDVYTQSLAESLLLAPKGGAVAVWASSGFTDAGPQSGMDLALTHILATNPRLPLGAAILQAKSTTTDRDVRRTWILFGDPAMHIHLLVPPQHPGIHEPVDPNSPRRPSVY